MPYYVSGLQSHLTAPQTPRCAHPDTIPTMANENLTGPSSCAPLLGSSSESDEDEDITEHTKKRRRQNKVWVLKENFQLCGAQRNLLK
ncbi:hypothetical protein EVAR_23272_1 [Eumeta japonica]|uniref:Uncharacterized protein n=1 Tax=Eumeta variegata TaxID=151549 RepID=A0A4C1V856_EUMVA|nr:hypothetical protein EVAR_23272_1 [Eumeta japonica]